MDRGGSQIRTRWTDITGGSDVLQMLSNGMEIELSDFKAENVTLKGDYMWQVVDISIGGVPAVFEVLFVCLFMSLGRMLGKSTVSTNLFDPI